MSFWTAVVIIVLIWGIVQIYTRRHDRDLGVTRDEDGNPVFAPLKSDHAGDATRREIEQLRERIKVLERIATDANSHEAQERRRIAEEIEDLRKQAE
jgi:signal transduction histidine kinase